MRPPLIILTFTLSLSMLAGCNSLQEQRFNEAGVPQGQRFLVGGGRVMDYTAREAGTLILINKTNNTPVLTKSLKAGENFIASADTFEHQEEAQARASDHRNTVYMVYFVPEAAGY